MPNGYVSFDGDHYNYNLYVLVDHNTGSFGRIYAQHGRKDGGARKVQFCNSIFDTDKECINYLLGRMISRLRNEGHRQRKDKKIVEINKKVWWNQK